MICRNIDQIGDAIANYKDKVIGITSGCYDMLHSLHAFYIQRCKRKCDILIVLLDSDDLMYENKQKVPVFNEVDRSYMMDSNKNVHCVAVMDSMDDFVKTFEIALKVSPNVIMFKNSDKIYGQDVVVLPGVKLKVIPDVNVFDSTTSIIKSIKS